MRVKRQSSSSTRLLLAGTVLLLPLFSGAASSAPPDAGRPGGCDAGFHGGPPHPPGPPGPGFGPMGGDHEDFRAPPFLMGLKLTDEQDDKVFAILHAAAPALRDQFKALRKARDALHDLTRSAQYSNDAAASLAQAQGRAESQLALLRTRTDHDIYVVLTADQRKAIDDHERDRDAHRGEGPSRP